MNGQKALALLILGAFSLLMALPARSSDFCVYDEATLQAALDTAGSNGEHDTIHVVVGTYSGNFTFQSTEGYSITLLGGYSTGCLPRFRTTDPSYTILDGEESGRVLHLATFAAGGKTVVEGFTFRRGKTAESGGGLYIRKHADAGAAGAISIKHCAFTENFAALGGCGASVSSFSYSGTGGDIVLANNTVTGNTATQAAGISLYASAENGASVGKITIANNNVSDNVAEDYYGGISIWRTGVSGDLVFTDNVVERNVGTGVEVHTIVSSGLAGGVLLSGNTITGNISDGHGGGAWIYGTGSSAGSFGPLTLISNIIRGNSAHEGGGVKISLTASSGDTGEIKLVNNIIAGNIASVSSGGGVNLSSRSDSGITGQVTVTNNTITGNTSLYGPAGAYFNLTDNTLKVYNNIIWGNTSPAPVDLYFDETGGVTAHGFNNDYSATARTAWTSSGGNIDADPLFFDASAGNYRIRYASPCRNAGLATAPEVPATDFEGELRKQVDIGADENPQANLPAIPLLLLD